MIQEVSELIGLQIYTPKGIFLGNVNNVILNIADNEIDGLYVAETNPLLVEGSRAVSVPYRWIQSVGDVIILRYFPNRVNVKKEKIEKKEEKKELL
ncbi:MAG: PRC-barrel domain-containing protein [Thermoplasmata archaeon]